MNINIICKVSNIYILWILLSISKWNIVKGSGLIKSSIDIDNDKDKFPSKWTKMINNKFINVNTQNEMAL